MRINATTRTVIAGILAGMIGIAFLLALLWLVPVR